MIKRMLIKLFRKVKHWDQIDQYSFYRKKYALDGSFRFNGESIYIYGNGKLITGKNSYIGAGSTIQLDRGHAVSIGHNCRISHNVRIYTSSAIVDQDFSNHDALTKKTGDVIIGDNVWIGVNVFINPGIKIGDNAVIGANSVVTKNVEPFAIYGGVPAKFIRHKKMDA